MNDSPLLTAFLSWLPLLLILGIGIWGIRKLGHMNKSIERIAKALEDRADISN